MIHENDITMIIIHVVEKLYENDICGGDMWCKFVVEVCLIHEMSYSFVIHSTTFLVLIDDEFLISDGIVFHITGPEYDKLFFKQTDIRFWDIKILIVMRYQVPCLLLAEKDFLYIAEPYHVPLHTLFLLC